MRALEFIRDHVTFKLPYDFSYHMKTPMLVSKSEKNLESTIKKSQVDITLNFPLLPTLKKIRQHQLYIMVQIDWASDVRANPRILRIATVRG